jgi:hypothetical protein
MGNKQTILKGGAAAAPTQTLKDTSLRSVIFSQRDIEVISDPSGQVILKSQVDKLTFDTYTHTLKVMAQLSRLVYCDSGILQQVLISAPFGTEDNVAVNSAITAFDKQFAANRRAPSSYANSKEGRPAISYVLKESAGANQKIATYISSPSDLTCLFVTGTHLSAKLTTMVPSDAVLVFKGSSTMKNFKHDLYSQFTRADLSTVMPPGTAMTSTTKDNFVPASFVKPILKSWDLLKREIMNQKPTRLFITGHSLGGAYATLFGFILAECGRRTFPFIQTIHIVSFGSPTLLGDGARNTFNAHLDSGYVTLDRVTSYGSISKIPDIVPTIPVGFSHPGFQPLKTELYPEKKTGRAYNLEMIRKVYQKGGLLGIGVEKGKYEAATKLHSPNKVVIPARTALVQTFAHAEYFDMTFLGGFRLLGMKNPGFRGSDGKYNIFYADLFTDGVQFKYVDGMPEDVSPEAADAVPSIESLGKGGVRKTLRRSVKSKKTLRKKQWKLY